MLPAQRATTAAPAAGIGEVRLTLGRMATWKGSSRLDRASQAFEWLTRHVTHNIQCMHKVPTTDGPGRHNSVHTCYTFKPELSHIPHCLMLVTLARKL